MFSGLVLAFPVVYHISMSTQEALFCLVLSVRDFLDSVIVP